MYATQDFVAIERELDEKKERIRRINRKEKRASLLKNNGWANMLDLTAIKEMDLSAAKGKTLYSIIAEIPVHKCFRPNLPEGEYFPCLLFPQHFAWVYIDEQGHSRYFTRAKRSKDKMYHTVSLDITDLVELGFGLSNIEACDLISKHLSPDVVKEQWPASGHQHYRELMKCWQKSGLRNHKVMKPLIHVLEELIQSGESFLVKSHWSHEGNPVFFASHRYLAERAGEGRTTFTKKINTLASLGIIRKVPIDDVPDNLRNLTLHRQSKLGYGFHLSYFSIPSYKETLELIESNLRKLNLQKLSYGKSTKEKIRAVMGEESANKAFPQLVDNTKKTRHLAPTLRGIFGQLMKNGPVRKQSLIDITVVGFTAKEVKRVVEREWMTWIQDFGLEYRRPKKHEVEKYQLSSNEFHALPKRAIRK
ncbi:MULTISPECIES: hypothetical protein [unclassified Psychrobacillus]|uniref:hypothetical protein n=1 Tax=unclassified Psychrobacillus TaxID=2636677 RepID=UPI0030FA426C